MIKTKQIKAGTFMMGSPDNEQNRMPDEKQHSVTLTNDIEMSETTITNQQYADIAQWAYDNGHCRFSNNALIDNLDGSTELLVKFNDDLFYCSQNDGTIKVKDGRENHPVAFITWYGAVSFCDWMSMKEGLPRAYNHATWKCNNDDPYAAKGYRLPTEAEWEYACRAGTTTRFNTGDSDSDLKRAGWYNRNSNSEIHPVAQKEPNAWGLYDMHGNVYEWCDDMYGDYDEQ